MHHLHCVDSSFPWQPPKFLSLLSKMSFVSVLVRNVILEPRFLNQDVWPRCGLFYFHSLQVSKEVQHSGGGNTRHLIYLFILHFWWAWGAKTESYRLFSEVRKSPSWVLNQLTDLVSRFCVSVRKSMAIPLPWWEINGVCYECLCFIDNCIVFLVQFMVYGGNNDSYPLGYLWPFLCCCPWAASIDPVSDMLICSCLPLSR